jgi:membrane protease YdiL (CAAX protease family)/NAD-dependent dihydropyrimidine dehydrogenase PreA subunit
VSGTGIHLSLQPDRCDHCGRCVPACAEDALRVGPSYIGVDWNKCTQCFACVEACSRQAIQRTGASGRGAAAGVTAGGTSGVVVGSRAEAKALRKSAEKAAKSRGKAVEYAGKPAAIGWRGAGGKAAPAAGEVAASSAHSSGAVQVRPVRRTASSDGSGVAAFVPGSVVWGIADLMLVLGVLLLTVLAKDAVLGLHSVGLMPSTGRTIVRASVLAVYYSLQLAVFAWLAARHGATLWAAFGVGDHATDPGQGTTSGGEVSSIAGSLGLVLMLFVGTEAFAVAYGLVMQAAGLTQPARLSSDLSEVFGSGGAGLLLSVALVALVAPFVEEIAFRGVVMPVFGARWGMWPAVVASAVIFAAYHLSLWLFAPTLVLGIALGWLAWTRRSLIPAILLHVLYNAAAVAAGFFVAR